MIEFYTFIPELVDVMPIKKAKVNNFSWYEKMVANYKSINNKNINHTAKCPGILSVCNFGWIQCAYQDIHIVTNGDQYSFTWETEIDQINLNTPCTNIIHNYVDYHPFDQLFKFNTFKQNTLKTVIKIQSPWVVKIPTGFFLLSMPIPYNDSNDFTAAHGLLKGVNWLNVQLFWHSLDKEVVIKKGTPLCQYILIKNEDYNYSVNQMNSDILLELEKK